MNKKKKQPQKEEINFTDRQLEVLRSWADNPNINEAAANLQISVNTMHTMLKRMRQKLKVNRTFDVYKYAIRHDLFDDSSY